MFYFCLTTQSYPSFSPAPAGAAVPKMSAMHPVGVCGVQIRRLQQRKRIYCKSPYASISLLFHTGFSQTCTRYFTAASPRRDMDWLLPEGIGSDASHRCWIHPTPIPPSSMLLHLPADLPDLLLHAKRPPPSAPTRAPAEACNSLLAYRSARISIFIETCSFYKPANV